MACLIAAPCSGSGKTLLSLSLAAHLRRGHASLQTFKVGPDYLDPQLLARVSGRPCRNLDPLLCGEDWLQRSFHWWGSRAEHCLVEGVMGLFDGRGSGSAGSSAEVAELLGLPVVLVVEASRQAGSVAALVRGFRDHRPSLSLAGVVLNGIGSERHRALLGEALEAIAMPVLGVLPRHPDLSLPSRHLGLLPAHELEDLDRRREQWAALAERHLDLERLLPLLAPPAAWRATGEEPADPIRWSLGRSHPEAGAGRAAQPAEAAPLPLAIAADAAFHFRYPEATELLTALGVEPRPWRPLDDEPLPEGCRGVILPGGYPELHAEALAAARRSLDDLRRAAGAGLPIYAECGGLLLLGERLEDPAGVAHPMAGVLPFTARRGELQLGYRQASPRLDGLVVRRGEILTGHEFHRWELAPPGGQADGAAVDGAAVDGAAVDGGAVDGGGALWQLEGWGWPPRPEGWTRPALHASWLHLHWAGCSAICRRLVAAAARSRPWRTAMPPAASAPAASGSAGGWW